ncbi:MAG: Holliday junction resolvase RuvX [bacterium]
MEFEEAQRCLGIDWGMSKIGLALGDAITKIATPYKVVKNIGEVLEVIRQEAVDQVILGQPIQLAGDPVMLASFNSFHQTLVDNGQLPVALVDERLTTKQAGKLSQGSKQTVAEDAIAAMLILQSYFDRT